MHYCGCILLLRLVSRFQDRASTPASAADPASSPAAEWVAAWHAGDDPDGAFQKIYKHYFRPVWRFFRRRGFPSEQCRDLTQDTFVRVYKGMDGFRGEARFETWLFRIATNTYRKALRYESAEKRSGNEVSLEEPEGGVRGEAETADAPDLPTADPPCEPLEDLLGRERRDALRAAVADLPEQMRRCTVLRIYQGLAYREIAAVLQVSIETVKAHLFQSRKRLTAALEQYFEDVDL